MLETFPEIKRLLVLADDDVWKSCFHALQTPERSVLILEQSGSAITDIFSFKPQIVCLSYSFFVKAGLSFFENLIRFVPGIPVILLSEVDDMTIFNWIMTNGGQVISGNPEPDYVLRMLGRCLEKVPQRLEKAVETLDFTPFDTFIGETEGMRSVKLLAARFARSDLPVLITGETGTGKSFLAEAVHKASLRSQKPFIPKNMAEVQESIAENILFGSVKGGFTSAETRPGLFEAADGGTLFLDEITEASQAVQAKLLRVIGSGQIQRVGSNRQLSVNVRLIAASNRDLAEEVSSGRFRQDLYYRIAPLTLVIPPLRERLEDIPLLLGCFLKGTGKNLSRGAVEKLLSHTWPGNVRELSGCIKRAALMCIGDVITESDISFLPGISPVC